MTYPRNLWYVAGYADEVEEKTLLARTLLEERMLLFRETSGALRAIADRCAHRLVPLHLGKHWGDGVACAYHGLRYDGAGSCVANPHQEGKIPAALKVRSYPVAEQHEIIWLWPGDPELAEISTVPDLSVIDRVPATARSKGYLHVPGHFELLTDNIMDLSHVDFLHPTTLGTGSVTGVRPDVDVRDRTVRVRWPSPATKPMGLFVPYLLDPEICDQWLQVDWQAPAVMILKNGATPVGAPEANGVSGVALHLITPETATSSHYFFVNTRNFDTANAGLTADIAAFLYHVFAHEDEPMIAAQQRSLGSVDFMAANPVLLGIDHAPIMCRRIMQNLVKTERHGSLELVA